MAASEQSKPMEATDAHAAMSFRPPLNDVARSDPAGRPYAALSQTRETVSDSYIDTLENAPADARLTRRIDLHWLW